MAESNVLLFWSLVIFVTCSICQGTLLGGWQDADVSSTDVKEAAAFATEEWNNESNNMFYMQMTKIVNAQKQLVNGMNYKITVELTSTTCRKNQEDKSECKPADKVESAHTTQLCNFEVYVTFENPPTKALKKMKCEAVNSKQPKQKPEQKLKLKLKRNKLD